MLSKEEEAELNYYIDVVISDIRQSSKEAFSFSVVSGSILWLAEKLKEVSDELKRANAEIERINKAYNWEEPCPHGYKKGDHHWFHCMGVSPFDPEVTGN